MKRLREFLDAALAAFAVVFLIVAAWVLLVVVVPEVRARGRAVIETTPGWHVTAVSGPADVTTSDGYTMSVERGERLVRAGDGWAGGAE